MKETKKFFDANGLNKGYSKALFSKTSNLAVSSSSQYKHIMPPLDVMAAYEEISPGTIKKIIEMAQKEQNYRHSIELLNVEKYDRAVKFGKICGVALIGIIAMTVLILAFGGHYMIASVFFLSAFATIGGISFFQSDKRYKNKVFHKNFDQKNRVHNHKARSNN